MGAQPSLVVAKAIPNTLLLAAAALGLALLIGIPLGIFAALEHNAALDRIVMSIAVLGFSIPTFFLGILLIVLFALTLRWLPSSGTETWWHLIMPTLTLAAGLLGKIARFTRTAILEVLGQSFVRTARAKGVPRLPVMASGQTEARTKHVRQRLPARNARCSPRSRAAAWVAGRSDSEGF